jgi:hypothetical protein
LNLMIQDSELLEQLKPEDEEDFYYWCVSYFLISS